MKQRFIQMSLATLVAISIFIPLPVSAKGGGGGGSMGGGGRSISFSRPTSSPGFFKPPPATAPAPAPVKQVQVAPPPANPVPAAPAKTLFAKQEAPVGVDKKAFVAQQHADSKAAFDAAKNKGITAQTTVAQNVSTVTQTSGGKVYDISALRAAREARVAELSAKMAQNQYRQREVRAQDMYGSYYQNPTPQPSYYGGGYRDSYSNPAFWWWLQQQPRTDRERFIYNHRSEIDPQRLEAMNTTYPELSAALNQLESTGVKPDTSYVPPSLKGNEDLMYGDDVAQQAKSQAAAPGSVAWIWVLLMVLVIGSSVYYVLFGTKWKVKELRNA